MFLDLHDVILRNRPVTFNMMLPPAGAHAVLHSDLPMLLILQVFRGAGDLLQGRPTRGALRHPLQENQPAEGPRDRAGNWADGADAGHAPKRLQTHRRHPGLPGLHSSADAPAVRHHPGEVHPV